MSLTRREMLLASGAALIGPAAATRLFAGPSTAAPKKVLFFTFSQTFQHGPITRKDGKLGMAEEILVDLGKKANLEVAVPSKDGTMFEPDKIAQWDAFAFARPRGDLNAGSSVPKPHHNGPPMSKRRQEGVPRRHPRRCKGFVGMRTSRDRHRSTARATPSSTL